jgi:hypothetical protein
MPSRTKQGIHLLSQLLLKFIKYLEQILSNSTSLYNIDKNYNSYKDDEPENKYLIWLYKIGSGNREYRKVVALSF